ncbi:Holliday junction resolvase RecU [Streptococcus sp. NLN76]|uniref:Holliday junction resolvase RecU n=1 Tax=Streptococcus sp. NLN76 TaxID=2822800 RepID=UPI0018AAD646|nr:Holliday junction resolvase RecU [Streptococcus sp. NLN76]MBF8970045.1 Holliday junction resolvase RecU [Streptococcus sp. NLN76]
MVQYPSKLARQTRSGLPRSQKKRTNFANRGMSFENMLNETNSYYLTKGLAVIHKKPTPVQIVRVDYPQRSRAKIVEAYFRQASTTDYSGVYRGYYLDFEAKETRQKTGMPLKNFHAHQIEHMGQVLEQEGICFALLHFSTLQETYLLPAEALIRSFQDNWKSLPIEFIREHGYSISLGAFPSVPYLEIIEEHLIGGKSK